VVGTEACGEVSGDAGCPILVAWLGDRLRGVSKQTAAIACAALSTVLLVVVAGLCLAEYCSEAVGGCVGWLLLRVSCMRGVVVP